MMLLEIDYLILLAFSLIPLFHAACPDGMYCPTGVDCGANRTLCESSTCPDGGNINLLSNWTDDCEEDVSLAFSQASYIVREDSGPSQPVLALSRAIKCCSVSVMVKIEEGSAKGGIDYVSKPSAHTLVVFSAGMTSVSFDILMIDDSILEKSETFTVSVDPISLPYGVTLVSPAVATVSIQDDDDVTVAFNQTTFIAYENNRLAQPVLVLSSTASYDITVVVSAIDVNATSMCDYGSGRHSVTFPAGVTRVNFNINITDDDLFEGPEAFNLAFVSSSLPSGVLLGYPNRATVTIVDDEKPISVEFNQSLYRVREHDGFITPVLTLSKPSPCCLTVRATLSDMTAIGGVDYAHDPTKIYNFTFPVGATCASPDASVLIIDDAISENDEAFSIAINEMYLPYGIKLGSTKRATVLIEDNDNAVKFERPSQRVMENRGPLIPILILDKPAKSEMIVRVDDVSISATGRRSDYVSGPYFARFRRNARRATIIVNIVDDNRSELDETFNLTINATALPFGVIRSKPYTTVVTMVDDEYTVCFSESSYTVQEGSNLDIKLVANKRLTTSINVRLRYDNSLTASGDDYRPPVSSYVRIVTGTDSVSISVSALTDRILEHDETFVIMADPPSVPDGIGNCSTAITIVDNDAITVRFERQGYPVANKNSLVQPVLLLSGAASFPFSIRILEVDGTATGDKDYEIQNYNPIFYPGETKHSLPLDPIDDDIVEDTEYYFLNISSSLPERVSIGRFAATKITIIDDDVSYLRVSGRDLGLSKPLYADFKVQVMYKSGRSRDITVNAGLTKVSLGAARNEITAIQFCPPKSIARDTRTYDPLVKMKCI